MLNVGLIGYGYWGPNLARNLAEADGVRLTTIADARPERRQAAERRHPGVKTCADAASLIGSSDVDAVVIATPLATHKALAADAINRGKHVLVEKPIAASRKDAEALWRAGGEARRLPHGRSHVRLHGRRAEDPVAHRRRRPRRAAVSRFRAREPRPLSAGFQRHLGSRRRTICR